MNNNNHLKFFLRIFFNAIKCVDVSNNVIIKWETFRSPNLGNHKVLYNEPHKTRRKRYMGHSPEYWTICDMALGRLANRRYFLGIVD